MADLFTKSLTELTFAEVEALVADEVAEGQMVEFKADLPARSAAHDPWHDNQERIGEKARNELLSEVIALANSDGGHLVLGIAESDAAPPVAARITPFPLATNWRGDFDSSATLALSRRYRRCS